MTEPPDHAPNRPAIRLVIVDDHPVVREGTAALLASRPGLVVVGTAGSVAEARTLLSGVDADVVLLDIRLGNESGFGLLAPGFIPAGSLPAVVMLTAYDYPQYADAARRMGAVGFVLKTAPLGQLEKVIATAAAGRSTLPIAPPSGPRVSDRELEVVRLVVDGRSNDEIGLALGIGTKTVESHLRRLFERFGFASRTELAARAIREGWLDVPPA